MAATNVVPLCGSKGPNPQYAHEPVKWEGGQVVERTPDCNCAECLRRSTGNVMLEIDWEFFEKRKSENQK